MALKAGVLTPRDMDMRQFGDWCGKQDTTSAGDVTSAIADHVNSVFNVTQAQLASAILAHTVSTDNTTQAELDSAIAAETVARDAAIAVETADRVSAITDEAADRDAAISDAIVAHEAAVDPHPQYLLASTVASGVYTPTLTAVTNVAASTAYQCQYMRVGASVMVSGKVDIDPTAAGSTKLGISLPVASNFGAAEDCAGTAFAPAIAGQGAAIEGDATNDRAQMEWIAVDFTNQPMYFSFMYRVI